MLAAARKKAGLTQQQLADQSTVGVSSIKAFEAEERRPSLPIWRLLRVVLPELPESPIALEVEGAETVVSISIQGGVVVIRVSPGSQR